MTASVVLAGGGTGGHIEPMLALADALTRRSDPPRITCLGTARGMETRLVPARGYDLRLIPPVPLPRKPTPELLRVPGRVVASVRETRAVLDDVAADVVVGFGGYVALPAYLAARWARSRRIPVVVHEQNALPGLANRVGARLAARVAVSVPGTPLHAGEFVGMPLRPAISGLDRAARRAEARAAFGLDADRPTLLVVGGSQGAASLNRAAVAAADALTASGVQVLHARGPKNTDVTVPVRAPGRPPYVLVDYLERMDLAYAAADLALCRAGAVTVAELAAVGLPAAFVPLPIGNGEQRRNAQPLVDAGGALMVEDAALSAGWITAELVPLLTDADALAGYARNAAAAGAPDADERLADIVLEVADERR